MLERYASKHEGNGFVVTRSHLNYKMHIFPAIHQSFVARGLINLLKPSFLHFFTSIYYLSDKSSLDIELTTYLLFNANNEEGQGLDPISSIQI